MKINFKSDDQLKIGLEYFHGQIYHVMYKFSLDDDEKKTKIEWIRPSTPFFEIASGFMLVVERVALVGENFLKGAWNVLSCQRIGTGLKQIVWGVPSNIFMLVPSSIKAAWIALSSLGFLFGSELRNYSRSNWLHYDRFEEEELKRRRDEDFEKNSQIDANERNKKHESSSGEVYVRTFETVNILRDEELKVAIEIRNKNLENAQNWFELAMLLLKEKFKGFPFALYVYEYYIKKAADLGHVEACFDYANFLIENEEKRRIDYRDEIQSYFQKAIDGGHTCAAEKLKEYKNTLPETLKDFSPKKK